MHPEPMHGQEVMPGDPAHERGLPTDDAFSNHRLDTAVTEAVGHMHPDLQGLSQDGSHNSGDLTVVGPVKHGDMPGDHMVNPAFGGGFGRVS